MDKTTLVLPSARAIRHKQLELEGVSLFLPNYITMSEFISKLCIVENFKIADEDSRILMLLEASDFKAFSKLQIQRNFFTFTKNSSYIFKFFEEVSAELYDIENLHSSDIYAEYEEHISILVELYKRYEALCSNRGVLDKIFLPKLYKFNTNYAKNHKNIDLFVEGHLTNFELMLLEKCCEFSSVNIIFNTTKFNIKMQNKFADLGIEIEPNFRYKISLNYKKIISKEKIQHHKNIICESLSESILQIAFIKKSIYDFIQKGYKAENIAVILPNEKMASLLKSFDEKDNFNFAMGESFSKSEIYERFDATYQYMQQDSKENAFRLNRLDVQLYEKLSEIYYKNSNEIDFIEFLESIKELFKNKRELKIYEEEIYSFKYILAYMQEMSVKSLLSLFLQRLASRSMDDVRGGKVTVMGVLETRMIDFDGVIIVDFSDANVPKKSDKDMFLNTKIREIAKLPTMSDRENLQKHYYQMLINRSKEVAISYVNSSDSTPSRFLKQLGIKENNQYDELDYASILYDRKTQFIVDKEYEIIQEYSFKKIKLSATRLKTLLTCKRKYFYRYIKDIDGHEIPKDMPKEHEIGSDIHSALKNLYSKKSSYSSVDELKKDLHKELQFACGTSELDKYLMVMQEKRMNLFCENEVKRFNEGWSVELCEESKSVDFAGTTLIGQIDRVDKRGDELFVLDYKTGSYPLYTAKNFTDAKDFQLEFYYLLAGGDEKNVSCGFYDLKESKIVKEPFLQEKLGILESNIKDLLNIEEVNFSKCDDVKNCIFCDYSIICGR